MTARFQAGDAMMSIADALARLESSIGPAMAEERLDLHDCLGRFLAEDVVSGVNVPPHDNSAVDGWAFRHADLPADGLLPVVGRVAAGHPFDGPLPKGASVRIFTGAPLPEG
ncbi:MAG: molybdopterin molybdenumtransferase MoeA, partial [Magnetospirillum sp.]|nr:molybdopterin molybdenumtransferase MoeA [Magnetospirillum sp.]